jgi:hypothetical protein
LFWPSSLGGSPDIFKAIEEAHDRFLSEDGPPTLQVSGLFEGERVELRMTLRGEATFRLVVRDRDGGLPCLKIVCLGLEGFMRVDDINSHGTCPGIPPVAHKGNFLLRFIDALAVHWNVQRIQLVDASRLLVAGAGAIRLTWLRAMLKGQGWYESHGYTATTRRKQALYRAAIEGLRATDVRAIGDTLAAVTAGPALAVARLFLSLVDEYDQPDRSLGAFIAWLWAKDPVAVVRLYRSFLLCREGCAPRLRLTFSPIARLGSMWCSGRLRGSSPRASRTAQGGQSCDVRWLLCSSRLE